jgi:2-polyprenyl-6-hydroxyphenyl methylase/3-demethylubiquinone-9 3-methyltransferase
MLNADPQELAKFSDLAHRWWDPESEFRPLHQINPLRLEWINALAPVAGQQVLDVGCGGGILAEAMARKGAAQVTGIDLAVKPLRVAQLHALEAGVQNVQYQEVAAEARAAAQPLMWSPAWKCWSTCPTLHPWCKPVHGWPSPVAGCSFPP